MASTESRSADLDQLAGSPSLVWLLVVTVVGGALGAVIALASREDVPDDLMVWTAGAIALTATSCVVAASGWMAWRELLRVWPGSVASDFALAGAVVVLGVVRSCVVFRACRRFIGQGHPANRRRHAGRHPPRCRCQG
jgi:hypothetical protein